MDNLLDIAINNQMHNKIRQKLEFDINCKSSHLMKKNCYKINCKTVNKNENIISDKADNKLHNWMIDKKNDIMKSKNNLKIVFKLYNTIKKTFNNVKKNIKIPDFLPS